MAEAKLSTWRGYDFYERIESSPGIQSDESSGLRYKRVYDLKNPGDPEVPFTGTIFGFLQALVGDIEYVDPGNTDDTTPGYYNRLSPHRIFVNSSAQVWRPWEGNQLAEGPRWAYCVGIDSVEPIGARRQVPFDDDGGDAHDLEKMFWPEYDMARVTVSYACLPFDLRDDDYVNSVSGELARYVVRKCQPAVMYVEEPGGYLKFERTAIETAAGVTPEPVNVGVGFPIGLKDLTYSWIGVLFPPRSADFIEGRINAPMTPSTYSKKPWEPHTSAADLAQCFDGRYPPGTLLLVTYSFDQRESITGQTVFDIHYKMRFNPKGHNYLYRHQLGKVPPDSELPGWTRVTSSGIPYTTWDTPYSDVTHRDSHKTRPWFKSANFNDLFVPYLRGYPPADTGTNPAWDYY